MKKSINDVLKNMETQRQNRIQAEINNNRIINAQNESRRKEWVERDRVFESLAASSAASSAGGGDGNKRNRPTTITLTSLTAPINNAKIVAVADLSSLPTPPLYTDTVTRGFVWGTSSGPTLSDNSSVDSASGLGTYSYEITAFDLNYVRAYVSSSLGIFYSNELSEIGLICLAKGTKILLSNGISKLIEEIEYNDVLKVWNFDDGKFDISNPLWIKVPQITNRYNLIKFSDGTELKTISQHRIFNKELGRFTYPMTDETPIGTTTFNSLGEEVNVISKDVINEEIEYYNIITNRHINLFSNNILTSCRYNNIYPIQDMKFIKDNRQFRNREEFSNISDEYFNGLRLEEQVYPIVEIESYINTLLKLEKSPEFV